MPHLIGPRANLIQYNEFLFWYKVLNYTRTPFKVFRSCDKLVSS